MSENTEVVPETKGLKIQTIIVTLADGRRGVFAGPEFVTATEMVLGATPRLVSVDFLPAREIQKPEVKSADQKIEAGSDAGTSLDQKA